MEPLQNLRRQTYGTIFISRVDPKVTTKELRKFVKGYTREVACFQRSE